MNNILSAIPSKKDIIVSSVPNVSKTTVEIVDGPSKRKEPAKKKTAGFTWKNKPIEEWNKLDLKKYLEDTYFQKYGKYINYGNPVFYGQLQILTTMIEKQGDIKGDCPHYIIKAFLDFCFDNYVNDILSWKKAQFSLKDLTKESIVLDFIKKNNIKKIAEAENKEAILPEVPDKAVEVEPALNSEELEDAYSVGYSFLIQRYGLLVAANYVYYQHKVEKETVINEVKKTYEKMNKQQKIISSKNTRQYTYPDWIEIKEIFPNMNLKFGNVQLLGFLKK